MKFKGDVDIDLADRSALITCLTVTPASILRDGKLMQHNTGVYPMGIPIDPFTGRASLDHVTAEDRGYFKLDLLNVNLYKQVRNEEHLLELMREPDWTKLYDPTVCSRLMHVNGHYNTLVQCPEPVNSIPRLAMFLAIIRPGKKHLIGLPWAEVAKTIWDKPIDGSYAFKKAHAISYSHLVSVNMNLIEEQTAIQKTTI